MHSDSSNLYTIAHISPKSVGQIDRYTQPKVTVGILPSIYLATSIPCNIGQSRTDTGNINYNETNTVYHLNGRLPLSLLQATLSAIKGSPDPFPNQFLAWTLLYPTVRLNGSLLAVLEGSRSVIASRRLENRQQETSAFGENMASRAREDNVSHIHGLSWTSRN